jgi:hypothetical protein
MERACNSILIVLMIGLTHSLNCLVIYSGNVKCDHDYKRCALAAPDSCDPAKIDKIALKRSITAPGHRRDRR